MDRRVSGGLMLLIALVAVLAVPRALNPPTLDGAASAEPPPPPPSVGDCFRGVSSGWSTDQNGALIAAGQGPTPSPAPPRTTARSSS